MLRPYVEDSAVLCLPSSVGVLLFPSTSGYDANLLPLPYGLTAFRCRFPRSRLPTSLPPPAPSCRVVVAADSMLHPFEVLSWPAPYAVSVRCFSGGRLEMIIKKCLSLSLHCNVFVFHAGVNDASRGGVSFADNFLSSWDFALRALTARFSEAKVAISTICLTKSDKINLRVAAANNICVALPGMGPSLSFPMTIFE